MTGEKLLAVEKKAQVEKYNKRQRGVCEAWMALTGNPNYLVHLNVMHGGDTDKKMIYNPEFLIYIRHTYTFI